MTESYNSPIIYRGQVTAKIMENGRLIREIRQHNEGKPALFKQLCLCLIGNFASNGMPIYFDVGTINADKTFKSKLSSPAVITSRYIDVDKEKYYAVFEGVVSGAYIKSTEDRIIDGFAVKSNIPSESGKEILAQFSLSDETITLSSSQVLIIQWKMSFVDATSSTTTTTGGNS